jgi:hypothetical protein
MPEGPKKVPAHEKAVIEQWLTQGARTAREEPDDPNQAKFTPEELSHWAFQPVKPHQPPTLDEAPAHPVDRFLLQQLRANGITALSPKADKRTLIRRATIDLTGLPPTPDDIQAFLADEAPDAYEKLIDRLLASPHYGERWGRHWLDVAGYAESEGEPVTDSPRLHAWRYRDAVIRSFNDDMPFDEFLRNQLAGDERTTNPPPLDDAVAISRVALSGFLRMAPDLTSASNTPADRNQVVADTLSIAGTAFLGLTVGCAQCHDHKYDPISAEDYYRLRAVLAPAFDLNQWRQPPQRLVDITPAADIAKADEIEAQAVKMEEARQAEMTEAAKMVQQREANRLPEELREPAVTAAETPADTRTAEQTALLEKYPSVKPISFIRGFFVEYDGALNNKFNAMAGEIEKVRATKPPRQFIMAPCEPPSDAPPTTHVMLRGDPATLGAVVAPGELTALCQTEPVTIAEKAADVPTSGRRLAYANWLTSGTHPLTARVFVNRVWLHHFGKGLVGTPNDFGLNGDRPTHPELLDWLAHDFVQNGWQIKRFHKLLMTSAAYQQSSQHTAELDAIDPDNRLLGRMNLRRLEAEAVRDAMLLVSGKLNRQTGGASIPVVQNDEGKTVLGGVGTPPARAEPAAGEAPPADPHCRRSVYVQHRRVFPLSMLDTFDLPVMNPNCDVRRCSTVAPQSLFFLNDEFVIDQSQGLGHRLFHANADMAERVKLAFAWLFAAEATSDELQAALAFVDTQSAYFREHGDDAWKQTIAKVPAAADERALSALCQTLLCSNRFLYVD